MGAGGTAGAADAVGAAETTGFGAGGGVTGGATGVVAAGAAGGGTAGAAGLASTGEITMGAVTATAGVGATPSVWAGLASTTGGGSGLVSTSATGAVTTMGGGTGAGGAEMISIFSSTGAGLGGSATCGLFSRAAISGRDLMISSSSHSALILSSELEGTLAAAMRKSFAIKSTSLLSMPSFFAMSYIRTGINLFHCHGTKCAIRRHDSNNKNQNYSGLHHNKSTSWPGNRRPNRRVASPRPGLPAKWSLHSRRSPECRSDRRVARPANLPAGKCPHARAHPPVRG